MEFVEYMRYRVVLALARDFTRGLGFVAREYRLRDVA
jgi:hypothetical protein